MRKVVFILGCTGCGKGAVAREFARRIGGQIVSVDSMKIYRRMDIGTAKPSPADRSSLPHHCVDLVEPSESFSVAQFVAEADRAIEGISAAGGVPVAAGGTSLYIKALTEGLFEGPSADAGVRERLTERARREGPAALHAELAEADPAAAERIHPNDERRIVRALEVFQATGTPISQLQRQWDSGARRYECVMIGLRRDRADQARRINLRAKRMMDLGLRDEVSALLAEPAGLSLQAAQAVGYAEMIDHLQGLCSLEEAFERIKINTRQLAKKQRTWHRRFEGTTWFDLGADDPAAETAGRILEQMGALLRKETR
ncbi:MAG: tRNA (adenosine(37)-N6)-dimethylallyltransferase MiaA [Planctomycetota bacterium]|nr:tRNA (adenosine(37)-N6)-dimethylallyltransferase MiaA [Planctomycetota bacterium]